MYNLDLFICINGVFAAAGGSGSGVLRDS